MKQDSKSLMEENRRKIEALSDQGPDLIESAAHHLEMLHFQNQIDFTKKDFLRLNNREFLLELERVAAMSPRELGVTATMVEDWSAGAAAAEENRAKRMEYMYKEYEKLCRLRANEPEAWDEINELYFDD